MVINEILYYPKEKKTLVKRNIFLFSSFLGVWKKRAKQGRSGFSV
jgi:hypothetical protein